MGASMLFIGWLGFNAGSANAANGHAALACLNTIIASATSAITWLFVDRIYPHRPRFMGMINGMIAGLIAITPCAMFVDPNGAFWIGFISGPICNYGASLKHRFGVNDALDAFGLHVIGGTIGGIMCGFFAKKPLAERNGVFYGSLEEGGHQLAMQLYGLVVCIGWSFFASALLLIGFEWTFGLRDDDAAADDKLITTNRSSDSNLEIKEMNISQNSEMKI